MTLEAYHPMAAAEAVRNLRPEQGELITAAMFTEAALDERVQESRHCFVGRANGELAVLWGVLMPSLLTGIGVIWAVTTTVADEHPFVFARHSKLAVDEIKQHYTELKGLVDPRYKRSIRWLKWLGFEVGPITSFQGQTARVISMKGGL